MAQALETGRHFQRELHHEAGAGLGRVGLSTAGRPSVAWNADETLCLVLEGEIYDTQSVERALDGGTEPPAASHAALILRLYERQGEAGLARLNGAFAVAIWDRGARRMVLFNDRLGLFPLYYARVNGSLLFASGVRALLADRAMSRVVDLAALNQFVLYDHVLDDRTLLESVRLLPQASVLTFAAGQVSIRPYWTLRYPQTYEPQPEEAYVEQFMYCMRQAVDRQKPDTRPAAVLLSGGLDSRLLLGLLCREDSTIQTLTFGIPGCDDARVAAELAATVKSRHHFLELKPDWLTELAEEGVRLTDGLGNIVNLHVLATLEQQSRHAEVLYKGFLGDALFGFALKRQMWGDYEQSAGYEVHVAANRAQGSLNYEHSEQPRLFTDAFQARVGDAAFDAYRAGRDRAGTTQLANQRLFFDLTQRVPRMTLNGVEVARSRAVVRLPFGDNDLLDFALTVPPGFLFDRYLPKVAFAEHFPRLAQIPIAGGRPLRSCARDVLLQARSLLAWHLQRYRLERLAGVERRPYKDYDGWFRTLLRPWVEGILLQPRTLERGYFRPEYVRQLVAAHMGGAQHAVRLGAMLTIELWHRQFVD
jgi:asparagine synthase (glutamine-hydrolysing)